MKQQSFRISNENFPREGSIARRLITSGVYGGDIPYRKMKRPLSTTKSIHVVFKMTDVAFKKSQGFRGETGFLNEKLFKLARRFFIRNYKLSINGNHIHLLCKIDDKKQFGLFLRAFSGAVGLHYKLKYGITGGLWKGRPFTRIVSWGRHFRHVSAYIVKNFKEVVGFIKYTPRKSNPYTYIERWRSTA